MTEELEPDDMTGGQPRRLGRFELLHRLGSGAMGEVWLARHCGTHAPAAIKMATRERVIDVRALRREIGAYARCSSAHIPRVLDEGQTDSFVWIAVEYIAGKTLDAVSSGGAESFDLEFPSLVGSTLVSGPDVEPEFRSTPRDDGVCVEPQLGDWRTVTCWFRDLARALVDLHGQDFLHRDIKPSNILISQEGPAYLIDFGLAFDLNDVTLAGFAGSPRYMAPEQVGVRPELSKATDVFGLAATFLEIYTGKKRFESGLSSSEILRRVQFEDMPKLADLRPGAPRHLNEIVAKALQRKPEDRYASADELLEDLVAQLEGKRPPNLDDVRVAQPWFMAALLVLALAAIVGFWRPWQQETEPPFSCSFEASTVREDPVGALVRVDRILASGRADSQCKATMRWVVERAAPAVASDFLRSCSLRAGVDGGFGELDAAIQASSRLRDEYPEVIEFTFIDALHQFMGSDQEGRRVALEKVRQAQLSAPNDARLRRLEALIQHVLREPVPPQSGPPAQLTAFEAVWFDALRLLWRLEGTPVSHKDYEAALHEIETFLDAMSREEGAVLGQQPLRGLQVRALAQLGRNEEALSLLETYLIEDSSDLGRRLGTRVMAISQAVLVWARKKDDQVLEKAHQRLLRLTKLDRCLASYLPWVIERDRNFCADAKSHAYPFEFLRKIPAPNESLAPTPARKITIAYWRFAKQSWNQSFYEHAIEFTERAERILANAGLSSATDLQVDRERRIFFAYWSAYNLAAPEFQANPTEAGLSSARKVLKRAFDIAGLEPASCFDSQFEGNAIEFLCLSFFVNSNAELKCWKEQVAEYWRGETEKSEAYAAKFEEAESRAALATEISNEE